MSPNYSTESVPANTQYVMSKEALRSLRDYIQLTLSKEDIQWLADELTLPLRDKTEDLTPYTVEELRAMVEEGQREIDAGEYMTTEEVLRPLFEEAGMDYDAEVAQLELQAKIA